MGCANCNTCEVSEKKGCGTSSVFDWLYQITNNQNHDTVEVQFKGKRKEYYANTSKLNIKKGDWVAVQGSVSGHDIGQVTLLGDLVPLQIKRKKIDLKKNPLKKIYRIASKTDKESCRENIKKEEGILKEAKTIISKHKLEMKLSDVEVQGDQSRTTFFYTAEKRVDFRELIKDFSKEFKTRIEMRQIGVRQEAGRLGGLGSCGRELCCSTWMTSFPSVSTKAARYQQLAINPQKISGQCGRLKCCLNFELDSYIDALDDFPDTKTILVSKKGNARYFKLDVFRKIIWYFYEEEPFSLIELTTEGVSRIIKKNNNGVVPETIHEFVKKKSEEKTNLNLLEAKLNRFDKTTRKKK